MEKRTQIRQGDILSITRGEIKRHIQYVCNDYYQLNGNIIYIFKNIYKANENPSIAEIVNDNYELVLHTTVRAGFKFLGWRKIGKSIPKDVSDILFFIWHDDEQRDLLLQSCGISLECNWDIWSIIREKTYETELPQGVCMPGFVYAPTTIENFLFDGMPLVHPKEKEQMIRHHIPLPPIATYKVSMQ